MDGRRVHSSNLITILISNMSTYNDNGLVVSTIPYTSDIPYVTEGAVIGMTFGWIFATIIVYVLGMCLIKKCANKYFNSSEKSSDLPRPRKPSSSSDEPALKGSNQPRSRLDV